ncbi:branched-chain amino acid transporter permease [Ancrocorticia populi]|uniref:Branched-chain amino acid ABC transporter n=1 Tax=Ancrocorticia populi TaxID=2175228 RepID=A0A2V1K5M4_9ACTO|nr:AzlD domain-containing protein [Ancrocorticia populi]PWF26604.1 branched-chain amino acid ABC transporter [Ancrocorticia populi]
MTHGYVLAAILVTAAVTWALRALPFVMLAPLRNSAILRYIGDAMPVGVMFLLAAYTLRDTAVSWQAIGSVGLAVAVTVAMHLWKGNSLISIFAGTGVYVVLASTLL